MRLTDRIAVACLAGCLSVVAVLTAPVLAAEEKPKQKILFTNVDVFDGFNEDLIKDANVLVEGNVIIKVSTDSIDAPDALVVDATGKTMTPGLIDMHTQCVLHSRGLKFLSRRMGRSGRWRYGRARPA
jgi:imidazolonepropionase-like amidohydrolase